MTLSIEQARFLSELQAQHDELRAGVAELEKSANETLAIPADFAYAEIVRKANTLIRKSGRPLSEDEAVAEVLAREPELYERYQLAKAEQLASEEAVEKALALNATRDAICSQIAERVARAHDKDEETDVEEMLEA